MINPSKVADYLFSRLRSGASDTSSRALASRVAEYAGKRNVPYIVPAVAAILRKRLDAERRKETVRIISPYEVSTHFKHDARVRVGASDDAPIDVIIDPLLIGGTRIEYGDRVIDASLRTKLDAFKSELLQETV